MPHKLRRLEKNVELEQLVGVELVSIARQYKKGKEKQVVENTYGRMSSDMNQTTSVKLGSINQIGRHREQ